MPFVVQPEIRDALGKLVRDTWVEECKRNGDRKKSHLVPWEQLNEADKEMDRLIGVTVFLDGAVAVAKAAHAR